MTESTQDAFERERYVVMPFFIAEPWLGFLWRYVLEREAAGAMAADPDWPGTPVAYGDVVMEHMLERLRPQVEAASGRRLFPTYSYFRLYKTGNALRPHLDRPACEISVSVNLGQEPAEPWPLWVRGPLGPYAAALEGGDALVYRGVDCEHWREPYEGARLAQVFLHYVNQTGPHASWKFDKRAGLALTSVLPL